jgi:hypothetical protein
VIVKVTEELIDINGMFFVMEVCLWIIGYCLATSRKLDSVDPKWLTSELCCSWGVRMYFSKSDNALSLILL